jgi:kinesin family protein C2/C3
VAQQLKDQLQAAHARSELEGKREERERGLGGEIEKMLKEERSSWAAERAEAKRLQQQQQEEAEERKKEHAVHVGMLKREIAALRQQSSQGASTAAAASAGEGELQSLRAVLADAQVEAERRRKEDDERLASEIERDAERDEEDKRRKEREAAQQQQLRTLSDELIAVKRELNSRSDSTEQLQSALSLLTAQKERMQEELNSLRLSSSSAAASFSSTVWQLAQQVRLVKEDSLAVRKACNELLLGLSDELVETRGFLLSSLSTQSELLASTMTKYKRELSLRRRLFNEVQELRGNIRVFCRSRPLLQADRERGSQEVVSFDSEEADNGGLSISGAKGQQQHFDFDRVFTQRSSQQEVFDATRALVTSVMDGYAVCIFAYGQTGTGKTHTMTGADSDRGINYRALNELFRIRDERRDEVQYDIKVSMKEIYREQVRDLLAAAGEEKELKLRTGPTGVYVEGLTEWAVQCEADVLRAMALGSSNRATGSTSMNEQSSRSHSLLSVSVSGRHGTAGISYFGSLHLIDLAGSERLSRTNATGDRLKEAQAINKSLSSLANVLESLQRKEKHIPYRDSKLTFLLQNSLGGHAKTLMIVNISPADCDAEETLCSLHFASRVKQVELGSGARTVTKTEPQPTDDTADGGTEKGADAAANKKVEEEKEAGGPVAAAKQSKVLATKAVPAASSSPRSDKKAAAAGVMTRSTPQPAVQKTAAVKRAAK